MRQFYRRLRRKDHHKNHLLRAESTPASASPTPRFHVAYQDPEPCVDIIALHGHGGHYEKSWTHSATSCFWLKDLLPGVFHDGSGEYSQPPLQVRVLSFGYTKEDEEKHNGAEGVATILLKELAELRPKHTRPIVWIAHSFGGPLLKGALSMSAHRGLGVGRDTKFVLFFGVPRDGEGWNNLYAAMTANSAGNEDSMTEPMKKMGNELKWLANSEATFCELLDNNEFSAKWFVENAGNPGNSTEVHKQQRVDVIQMASSHGQVIRFTGQDDQEWAKVKEVLIKLVHILIKENSS